MDSEGFDVVKSSSIIIKNSFGVCGLIILFFMILSPLMVYITYILAFKILSAIVSFLGEEKYAAIFENVSKSISYLVAVLVGVFLILFVFIYMMIISVSVI